MDLVSAAARFDFGEIVELRLAAVWRDEDEGVLAASFGSIFRAGTTHAEGVGALAELGKLRARGVVRQKRREFLIDPGVERFHLCLGFGAISAALHGRE